MSRRGGSRNREQKKPKQKASNAAMPPIQPKLDRAGQKRLGMETEQHFPTNRQMTFDDHRRGWQVRLGIAERNDIEHVLPSGLVIPRKPFNHQNWSVEQQSKSNRKKAQRSQEITELAVEIFGGTYYCVGDAKACQQSTSE